MELVFTSEADPRLVKLRQEGKVHILDLNYLLYCLNEVRLDTGIEPPYVQYSIKAIVSGPLSLPSPLRTSNRFWTMWCRLPPLLRRES